MNDNTTLNALVLRRARDFLAAGGWPAHTEADQRDPTNWPGWVSLYVRLDVDDIIGMLTRYCETHEHVSTEIPILQRAMANLARSSVNMVLSGNCYQDAPMLPGDGTQISFPYAGAWLREDEVNAVITVVRSMINDVCSNVADDTRKIQSGLATSGRTLFVRQTRRFRLVVKESDYPCGLEEDDPHLAEVLTAVLQGARFGSIELHIVSDMVEHTLAFGVMTDTLHFPQEPSWRWFDRFVLREVVAEARHEINSICQSLGKIRLLA